jgi:hypothetical protein
MSLTKSDLSQIDISLESQKEDILERVDNKLEVKKDEILDEIDNKLTKLKSDFFEKIDPILKEVVTSREERPLIINRIEKIEKKLQIQTA